MEESLKKQRQRQRQRQMWKPSEFGHIKHSTPGHHLATPESDFQASGHGGKCPCYADTQLPPKSSLPPIERFSLNNGEGLGIEASVNCLARSDTSFCCGCAIVGSTFADDSIKQLTTPE
jgi:hypothetical protein